MIMVSLKKGTLYNFLWKHLSYDVILLKILKKHYMKRTLSYFIHIFGMFKRHVVKYFYICLVINPKRSTMSIGLMPVKTSAVYTYNEIDNIYTISSLGKGGPIVTANTLEDAKTKFERALNLSFAVNNLLFFKGYKKATLKKYRGDSKNEITYTELQVA
jgi:hypothetical protein